MRSLKFSKVVKYTNSLLHKIFLFTRKDFSNLRVRQIQFDENIVALYVFRVLEPEDMFFFLASFLSSIIFPEPEVIDASTRAIVYLDITVSKIQYLYRAGTSSLESLRWRFAQCFY